MQRDDDAAPAGDPQGRDDVHCRHVDRLHPLHLSAFCHTGRRPVSPWIKWTRDLIVRAFIIE